MRTFLFTALAALSVSPIASASEFADPSLNQLALILPGSEFGTRGPIAKSCFVKMQLDPKQEPVYMNMTILVTDSSVDAIVSQSINGERSSRIATAEPEFSIIRPGLHAKWNADDKTLNGGERLILHAMMLSSNPEVASVFNSGIDLKKVRQAKVFYVDRRPQDMGSAAVIEALDENGKTLGTFLGGFLVARCN